MAASSNPRPNRAATLADVGRAAGVSAMAVSAVLNGARTSSRIAPKTRKRILAAAEKLGYRPNIAARALATRRMQTIGVAAVIEGGDLNYYFLEIFNGILAAAAGREQNTTMFALHDWGGDAVRLANFCDGRIDGLILVAPTLTAEGVSLPAHTPFVSIHANARLPGVVNIESDEERGAYEMVRALLAHGHRRIMHLAGPPGMIGAERRIAGYERALVKAGLTPDPDLIRSSAFSGPVARDVLHRWLKENTGRLLPQAIFCASDDIAIGCMEVLSGLGLRVPDDISIAGFDDTLAARLAVPQLTSVRQPLRVMGEKAVELLLARIDQDGQAGKGAAKSVVLPVDLITRASVAAPPLVDRIVPVMR